MADKITSSKRKKVSKKSKRSWRKHSDIKDVEEHLEEVRRDERTGGAAAEKPDERLFFVDKETKEESIQKHDRKGTRRSKKRKILKADQLLLPEPFFKPVGSKKRKINKKIQRKRTEGGSDCESSGTEEEAWGTSRRKTKKIPSDPDKHVASYDLWATEDKLEGDEHFLRTTRKSKIKAPKTLNRKTSQKPAIEVCNPGASYNPTHEDHQDLLKAAHEVEVKKLKEIEKIERKLQFPTAEEVALLPSWEVEMSQGLFGENEDEDDGESDDDDDEAVVVKPVRASNRKTKQDRMKLQEQREADRKVRAEKEEASRQNQIYRLKVIKKEIGNKEKEQEKRQKKKEEKEKKYADEPKRLGKFQYQRPEIEIQLSDELTGNIRTLKPEGSLFQDRYKSLQRRNMIEPRKRVVPHRKYALKEYERRSSKKPCIKEI